MAIDTPPRSPTSAAVLLAWRPGYGVAIYEQAAEVAVAVKVWGPVRMFIPFGNAPVAAGIGRGIGP